MNLILNQVEVRVLGSLIEKEATTPDYYPLSLNSLTNACNQKSNRHPVMDLSEKEVDFALESLKENKLVWQVMTSGSRTSKYKHDINAAFNFTAKEIAVLCTLLLRGPQTPGEIKLKTVRIYPFENLAEVESTLQRLINYEECPIVEQLHRNPGQKERRYAHLLCGQVKYDEVKLTVESINEIERISELEQKVDAIQNDLDELKAKFNEFIEQF